MERKKEKLVNINHEKLREAKKLDNIHDCKAIVRRTEKRVRHQEKKMNKRNLEKINHNPPPFLGSHLRLAAA